MTGFQPRSMEELRAALSLLTERGKIVAGGTDYVIQARRGKFAPDALLYAGLVPELRRVEETDTALRIGAMVTMNELAARLGGIPQWRAVADAAADMGSPQVRAKATMAGNLCNASPAGDMLPVALLYDAKLEILDAERGAFLLPMESFLLGPQRTALEARQMVTAIVLDRAPWAGCVSAFRKIGSRNVVSIARESIAALLRTEGGMITLARFTLGAVANTPIRVPEAEELLIGRRWDASLLDEVFPLVSRTVHDNCRPANRLYKTEAARGMTADLFALLDARLG